MNAFDKVIGYKRIKDELLSIYDMFHNKEAYKQLGARLPCGVLIYGATGLGKTMMAKCLIAESRLNAYTVGHSDGTDEIIDIFRKAKENAPSIVFMDDIDRLTEYTAIQYGIDEVRDCDVLVLATAIDMDKLPAYLIRHGRFDRKLEMCSPSKTEITEFIEHYFKDKKIDYNVNIDDLTNMANYSSFAELETILNEAAISSALFMGKSISMYTLTNAVLRIHYNVSEEIVEGSDELRKTALHEAGHLVACEVLCPGSVGVATLKPKRETMGGFIGRCKDLDRRAHYILVSLAGKAAVELYYSETCASGCQSDIYQAVKDIQIAVSESGTCGMGMLDVSTGRYSDTSDSMNSRIEAVVHAELERYMFKVRDILLKNRAFLEEATELLLKNETLLHSDIKVLRESVSIVEVEV